MSPYVSNTMCWSQCDLSSGIDLKTRVFYFPSSHFLIVIYMYTVLKTVLNLNNLFKKKIFSSSGPGKVHPGAWTEQSQVVVETVTKSTTTQNYSALQQTAGSDASKVVTQGVGLKRAFSQKEQTFQVDASKAGKWCS